MKKQLLLFAGLVLLSLFSFAQNPANLVIFSEDGDLFFAYVNGIRQNDSPQANVKITGLTFPNVSLRIEFNDKALPSLKQNMVLEPGYEHTAKIVRDLKKQVKLKYFGQAPIADAQPGAGTVAYHPTENQGYNTASSGDTGGATTVTSTTTTTQVYNNNNVGNGSVNVTMNGMGVNMNVSGMDPNAGTNSTTSTTVTTSSHSSGSSSSSSYNSNNGASNTAPATPAKTGCTAAMSPGSFAKMKQSVESKPFTDTKMSTAKVATKNACLSVNQVKEICKLFSMDDDKLIYAKYAYDYTVDKANYYQVSEVFSFSGTTEDLNKYIEEH